MALGKLDGVYLSFTDATPLASGELLLSAAAESSPNTYDDGPCAGAVIGWLTLPNRVRRIERVAPAHKVEGIALVHGSAERDLWLLQWNGQMTMDSPEAALYAEFWQKLVTDVFERVCQPRPGHSSTRRGSAPVNRGPTS